MTISRVASPVFRTQAVPSSSSRSLRVLFLAPFPPHLQANHGGGRVIAQLIAHLARRHSIGLCYLRTAQEPGVDKKLRESCEVVEEVVLPGPNDPGRTGWFHRLRVWKDLIMGKPLWAIDRFSSAYSDQVSTILNTWQPDIVQIEFHIMGQYLSALKDTQAPLILVQHEPGEESAREFTKSSFAQGRIVPQMDLLAWGRFERRVIQQVQTVVVFTKRDEDAVTGLDLQTPVVQIPLGVEIPEHASQHANHEPLNLLFVGNFKHLPNVDAADRLMNRIFPHVQAQIPDARLFIVGEHLPSNLNHTPNNSVILTGRVPDVKHYLDQAAVVVVPLRLGGGMRVKILEALAAGKPVVASRRAIEGLALEDGRHLLLAESDGEFSHAVAELLRAPDQRSQLAREARAWACANLSWEKTALAYEDLYHRLLRDGRITSKNR